MTIAEVSQKYQLTADTLRYYERIKLIPPVNRNSSGIRDYTEEDCNWVNFIKCMRGAGLSIEVLAEYVSLFQQGNQSIPARKALLLEQRRQLADRITEMQETLKRLDYKIEGYEERLLVKEAALSNNEQVVE
ncbi:MerR family transcriptional regulator [Clostridium sp. KNHs205]|jgi:DNA-binding transcriptional MerR regulator|uniref:MerR family transcriptional regulator n=1 Tax=Clostridium sp. KNHs205 TaxID=1449050 RepID=UPI00051BF122|nr:MerR family transcriptional regulator [Clostridium sp. KNHs205]